MATSSLWANSVLDEAAAIIDAEWMRLQQDEAQDEALWEEEVADLFADTPAPRPVPPRAQVTATTQRPWSGHSMPANRRRWPMRRRSVTPVWAATQRSPPFSLVL